jgi:hypothetical protein
MNNDAFELAACPEHGDIMDRDDLVTDEEFDRWVRRSQARTDEVMADWDDNAAPRADGPEEDWNSIEFRQELVRDDDIVTEEVAPGLLVSVHRRRRQRAAARADHRHECMHPTASAEVVPVSSPLPHAVIAFVCDMCGEEFGYQAVSQLHIHPHHE